MVSYVLMSYRLWD